MGIRFAGAVGIGNGFRKALCYAASEEYSDFSSQWVLQWLKVDMDKFTKSLLLSNLVEERNKQCPSLCAGLVVGILIWGIHRFFHGIKRTVPSAKFCPTLFFTVMNWSHVCQLQAGIFDGCIIFTLIFTARRACLNSNQFSQ
jgi:hypothetical protein